MAPGAPSRRHIAELRHQQLLVRRRLVYDRLALCGVLLLLVLLLLVLVAHTLLRLVLDRGVGFFDCGVQRLGLCGRDSRLFLDFLDALADPQGWAGRGGPGAWGFVKFGHTSPLTSNSGTQTLLLLAYGFYNKTSKLSGDDILNPAFQRWLTEGEQGVTEFGDSTGSFMTNMVRFGPSKYDVVAVYENLALQDVETAQGRWGQSIHIYYPPATLLSDHPYVTLQAPWTTPEQRAAAAHFRDFLLSLMDHTPGQGQYRDIEQYVSFIVQWRNANPADIEAETRARIRKVQNEPSPWRLVADMVALAPDQGIPIASHDDDTIDTIDLMADLCVTISEFPVTMEAAREARRRRWVRQMCCGAFLIPATSAASRLFRPAW